MREGLEFGKVEEESVEMDMDTDMDEIGREMKKKKKKQKRRRRERGLVKETNTVVKGECYPAAQRGFFQLFVLMNLRYHIFIANFVNFLLVYNKSINVLGQVV